MPQAGAAGAPPGVDGRVARFDYSGPWALLRMIALQRPAAAVLNQLSDRRPETLGFVVPLGRNPAAVTGGDNNLTQAKLFMRLGLTGIVSPPGQPDKHQPISLSSFPRAAP
jgi:hypothetical protein